jgi:transposase
LSSQNISRILKTLGDEKLQRDFFREYLKLLKHSDSIIIDATSLPNQIGSSFTQWGRNDGAIDKQFRFLCVVDQKTAAPLFYRFLPGNIVDVSTLQKTIEELELMGISKSFVLIDAGYFSEDNVKKLYELKIDFMSRLPASRIIYKEIIETHCEDLESSSNFVKCHERGLFIKSLPIDLFGNTGYAYIVLDPIRKGKEVSELISNSSIDLSRDEIDTTLASCGIMILVSSIKFNNDAVIASYHSRQSVEQIFGFFKDDLDSLPIRCHSDDTIKGYLFLQFLALIIFTQLRTKLPNKFSVEQALLILRSLKAKVFENQILIAEKNKNVRLIFEAFNYIMPNSLGI